ncbi:signal transduction histidine kinase [Salinibacter ruber]|uniref:histidine kinase n=1 Tax=Salinibacter ruber TaxID=146919 RepID=A0A9X2VAM5_9BACT|nr:ATP-binding protein [Salinibacter ruber]MCS3639047.1 signal transduction histidine kinase [Salinibacter ruber]MCS3661685.1 signal transduction histidine kinase [Salinibacter ruber]MCS3672140.1 signal transduction histidine kinase [Salinibacter ruber]MCS3707779.1 signal transduction histidine kinase [Salinibacter ruber]MCS3711481.1 signal transduction histidine kinase [Salinibacter ruber]
MSDLAWPPFSILRPEGEELSGEQQSDVQAYRLLGLLGAVVVPVFGVLLAAPDPQATDPMWARLGLSALLVGLVGASYASGAVRRRFAVWARGACYILMAWYCSVATLNGFAGSYDMGLLLLYGILPFAVAIGARSMRPVWWFLGSGLLAGTVGAAFGPVRAAEALPTVGGLATVAFVEGVVIWNQLDARERLERQNDLFRRAQKLANIGAWEYEVSSGEVFWTRQVREIHGLPQGYEPTAEEAVAFYHPEDQPVIQGMIERAIEEEVPFDRELRLGGEALPVGHEQREGRWVRARGTPQIEAGEVTSVRGTFQDITERKAREHVLENEREALRSMYRITADREAGFEEKARRLIDLGREHLGLPYGFLTRITDETQEIVFASGTHPLLQPGESCPLSRSYCRNTIQEDRSLVVQDAVAEGWAGDPAHQTFELGAYVGAQIIVEGELYGTFCFAAEEPREQAFAGRERVFVELMAQWASYELGQRRAKAQLKRQNARLDSFAGLVAHDLRNPLNVATGRLRLAREERAPEEARSHLAAVDRSLGRMDEIIEDVLTLTWGGQDIGPEELSTHGLAAMAKASWDQVGTDQVGTDQNGADKGGAEGATLQFEGACRLRCSAERVRRLLENLFRNAIEHGGDTVTVRVGALSDGFYVEDDGAGFPGDDPEAVFEAGYSSSDEGTGLGLSIVESIAKAHGWSLSATQSEAGGARFEVTGVDVEAVGSAHS